MKILVMTVLKRIFFLLRFLKQKLLDLTFLGGQPSLLGFTTLRSLFLPHGPFL